MVKRIIWSAQAISDRVSILDYWYQWIGNKKYSIKLDKSLRELIKKLAKHSPMGRLLKIERSDFLLKIII
jgi:plasmid stabilization system protein ParE